MKRLAAFVIWLAAIAAATGAMADDSLDDAIRARVDAHPRVTVTTYCTTLRAAISRAKRQLNLEATKLGGGRCVMAPNAPMIARVTKMRASLSDGRARIVVVELLVTEGERAGDTLYGSIVSTSRPDPITKKKEVDA